MVWIVLIIKKISSIIKQTNPDVQDSKPVKSESVCRRTGIHFLESSLVIANVASVQE